jgi:hypothetical protein
MTPSPLCRKLAILALAGALLAPTVQAGEARSRPAIRDSAAPLSASWQVLQHLWGTLVSVWGKNGCRLDPDGRCAPQQDPAGSGSALPADNGCRIDPDGCAKILPVDNGCRLDPSGCARALPMDNGCRIDPSGCALHP